MNVLKSFVSNENSWQSPCSQTDFVCYEPTKLALAFRPLKQYSHLNLLLNEFVD